MIDVACGDGFYSRQFRAAGAEVVGVDESKEMIRLANEREAREPAPSVTRSPTPPTWNTSSSAPACTASTSPSRSGSSTTPRRSNVARDVRSLACVVRPSGRFVHLGGCFDSIFSHPENFAQYGIELEVLESHGDGSRCRWTVRGGGQSVSAENTMWTPATITAELEAAGFADIQWPGAEVGPEGVAEMGDAYWTDYLKHPYHAITCATRRVTSGA